MGITRILLATFVLPNCMLYFARAQQDDNSHIWGDPLCPCLPTLADYPVTESDIAVVTDALGPTMNYTQYGLGCVAHDDGTPQCAITPECGAALWTLPKPLYCDKSWCTRKFCYIDPTACQLTYHHSLVFPNSKRYFSYGTCGDADSFSRTSRLNTLDNIVLKIGINHNTGGWRGNFRRVFFAVMK
jgi:hypothetical protein